MHGHVVSSAPQANPAAGVIKQCLCEKFERITEEMTNRISININTSHQRAIHPSISNLCKSHRKLQHDACQVMQTVSRAHGSRTSHAVAQVAMRLQIASQGTGLANVGDATCIEYVHLLQAHSSPGGGKRKPLPCFCVVSLTYAHREVLHSIALVKATSCSVTMDDQHRDGPSCVWLAKLIVEQFEGVETFHVVALIPVNAELVACDASVDRLPKNGGLACLASLKDGET
jgi:hypothetical protein